MVKVLENVATILEDEDEDEEEDEGEKGGTTIVVLEVLMLPFPKDDIFVGRV